MAPKKRTTRASPATTTTTTTPITNAQRMALIDQGVADALAARDIDKSRNGDDSHNSGTGSTEGVSGLSQWFKRMKSVSISVICPRNEIKKLEIEIWDSKVKGTDLTSYTQRFQELALLCGRMFPEESDKIEKYVSSLPDMIHRSVMASKPKTMQDAIEIATELMDKKISILAECQAENKRKLDNNNQAQQQPPKKQGVAIAYTAGSGKRKESAGTLPLSLAATNNQRNPTCYECGNQGHYKSDCPKLKTKTMETKLEEGPCHAESIRGRSLMTDSDATLYSSSLKKSEERANETNDVDESDMGLSNDNPQGDDDAARYGVFMHNKSTLTPNSTYLGLTVTSSSQDFIQTFLDETPANELMDFMSHLVYSDAYTTSVVHNPEGNPELTSYISCASEVSLDTHVDVLATKTLMQEMFPDENAHHIPSLPAKKIPYPTTTPQPNSLQSKSKKLMQKAKKNMRNIKLKKVVTQKFKEYDQKLEDFTNFNVTEAFEKVVQAKVLT
ncbi:reverse transcriptase domain-containing protein [Tanacetum coccineum]